MRTEQRYCGGCDEETDHAVLGFMPLWFTKNSKENKWEESTMCMSCGGLQPVSTDPKEVKQAHERYLRTLVEVGVMTEEEIEERLE